MKIPLTIDPQYCADWGFWQGVRELIQNAKDAEEYDGRKMDITHFPRSNKLVITTTDTTLTAAQLLLLGASSKRGQGQRGQFGEGFALGALALVRAGHPVTIFNGDEVWRPEITKPDEGHPFAGSDLLVFTTRKLGSFRVDFTVEVENVSKEVWEATKKLFLFLQPPAAVDSVCLDNGDTVLLAPIYQEMIFSRGIFVNKVQGLACGYDLRNLTLDRDRQVVNEWDLKWSLGRTWTEANHKNPAKFAPRIYDMAKAGKAEVENLKHHADAKLIKALREEYAKEYGEDTVPVVTMTESRELETMGAKTVLVNKTLQELLEKSGPTVSAVKTKLQGMVTTSYAWRDLTDEEQRACTQGVGQVTKDYQIVAFNDPTTLCRYLGPGHGIAVARSLLASAPRSIARIIVPFIAEMNGDDVVSVLLKALYPTDVAVEVVPPLAVSASEEIPF